MTRVLIVCPYCRSQFRRRMDCVSAIRRAEEAESRSTRAALTIAELRAEIERLRPTSASRELAVIDATARSGQ